MKRKLTKLEIVLFFLGVVSILGMQNYYLRSEIKPLREKSIEYQHRINTMNTVLYRLEKKEIYLDIVQDNISKAENYWNNYSYGGSK